MLGGPHESCHERRRPSELQGLFIIIRTRPDIKELSVCRSGIGDAAADLLAPRNPTWRRGAE